MPALTSPNPVRKKLVKENCWNLGNTIALGTVALAALACVGFSIHLAVKFTIEIFG